MVTARIVKTRDGLIEQDMTNTWANVTVEHVRKALVSLLGTVMYAKMEENGDVVFQTRAEDGGPVCYQVEISA